MKYLLIIFYLNGNVDRSYVIINDDIALSKQSCEYLGLSTLKNKKVKDYECRLVATTSTFHLTNRVAK